MEIKRGAAFHIGVDPVRQERQDSWKKDSNVNGNHENVHSPWIGKNLGKGVRCVVRVQVTLSCTRCHGNSHWQLGYLRYETGLTFYHTNISEIWRQVCPRWNEMLQEQNISQSAWAMNYKELNILSWMDAKGKELDILKHFLRGDEIKKGFCNSHLSEQGTAKWQFFPSPRMRRHAVQRNGHLSSGSRDFQAAIRLSFQGIT